MESFSQRRGLEAVRTVIQVDSMDDPLRVGLWNALTNVYWSTVTRSSTGYCKLSFVDNGKISLLCQLMWERFFRLPLDRLPDDWDIAYAQIRGYFFDNGTSWNKVCDFLEFVANSYLDDQLNMVFKKYCNRVMERELSGYRFVGGQIVDIVSKEEVAAVDEALEASRPLKAVYEHLASALALLADRETPDYRNSIKESISAVEAISRVIARDPKAELGQALKTLKDKVGLHPALEVSFTKLYGYTSDAEGIRHALMDEPNLKSEDARFMLVACSAFVNYLVAKSSRADVKL